MSARIKMEYASGEGGPVKEPHPWKLIVKTGWMEERNRISLEKVHDELPKKWSKISTGSPVWTDHAGWTEWTLSVVEGQMVWQITVVVTHQSKKENKSCLLQL